MREIELAIVGAGIAGVSSSIYAKRAGLEFLLFERTLVGGQLLYVNRIDNYVGVESLSGERLTEKLKDHLKELKIEVTREEIEKVEIREDKIYLSSSQNSYEAKSVIVATGASFRKLNTKGEDKFLGRGVSYCALCDGFFFKDKEVAVVGGGNTALEEALYLSSICKKVYLIHRRDKLRALEYLQKELLEKPNVEILWKSRVEEIRGDDFVKEIVLKGEKEEVFKIDGIFIAIGLKPNTEIFKGLLQMDEEGFIFADEAMKTSCDFIFACGDCRKRPLRQLITAAGEGAVAGISAYKYLRGSYIST